MKRLVFALVAAFAASSYGEVTRGTAWEDIPDGTIVSNVVDLAVGRAIERDPYVATTNGTIYIHGTALTEQDPVWSADKPNYLTRTQGGNLYQPKGNYLTSESDPTVAEWAKVGQAKPATSLAPATNYTDQVAASLPHITTNAVIDITAHKRDLTNNVCAANSFTEWSATPPSGYTFGDAQPVFNGDTEKWTWYVEGTGVAVDAESEASTASATSATFTFEDSGTKTFTATRSKVAYSNDVFTTYGFVTNAIATAAPSGGVSTNAVSGIITNHVTSGYLCTKAAAIAMTNGITAASIGAVSKTGTTTVRTDFNIIPDGMNQGMIDWVEGVPFWNYGIMWEKIWNIPITISGYGITDAYTKTEVGNLFATKSSVTAVSNTVSAWESYWTGDKVRISVTNYYNSTSGELPRLRIEEFDHSVTNGNVVSNVFKIVWDEESRHTNYQAQVDARIEGISNTVVTAAWRQTNTQLANKAPRAWQDVTSAGEAAPENTVWHTAPNTVFAGGTEYAHVAVGEGTICVLADRGAPVYTEGEEGQFRFCDSTGENYFGFDVRSAYTIGCRTDGISVDSTEQLVELTYDLTSSSHPIIMHSTNLVDWVDYEVTWLDNPPAGTQMCEINVGLSPKGFFKAELRYSGGTKFVTNMQADLAGGIAATNEVNARVSTIYPVVTTNGVVWRVKQ